jgi:hypothetical protein
MNDKAAQYVKLLKGQVDRIVVGVMFCLLAVMVFLWYMEQSRGSETVAGAGKQAKLDDTVATNPFLNKVKGIGAAQPLSSFPEIEQVAKYNMFDYKSVKDKALIEREANKKFQQAEAAAAAGRTDEAKRLLQEILEQFPSHLKARELRSKLSPEAPGGQPGPGAAAGVTSAPAGASR